MNLKDLAKHLGLSQTTVSRALNGYPEVNAKTRKRVQIAADKFNYRPSTIAQNLATGKAKAIGHVLPVSQQEIVNPTFTDFIAGAGEVYSANDYHMVLSVVSDQEEATAYRNMANQRLVDGVIVHGPRIPDSRIDLLKQVNLPFVVHGRSEEDDPDHTWMDVDNEGAFRAASELLLDLGHRRIALLNGLEKIGFAMRRRKGYEYALTARGLSIDPGLILSADMTEKFGYITAGDLLDGPNPPTAFLVSSTFIALGVQRLLLERGLVMGVDVSIVTFDDQISYLYVGSKKPIFTSTRSSIRDAGKICAEMLVSKIENPNQPISNALWEAELILGSSTGPAKG